jgi:hypothetical protein
MKNIICASINPSITAALATTQNTDFAIPKIYLITQFPLKVTNKLMQHIKNRTILLMKINAHYGIVCK